MRDWKKINPPKYLTDEAEARSRTKKNRYTNAGRAEPQPISTPVAPEPPITKYDARPTGFVGDEESTEVVVDLRAQDEPPVEPADTRTYYQRRSAHLPRINPD